MVHNITPLVDDEPKVTIELTLKQAELVSWAISNISRLQMMQFDALTEICHRKDQPYPVHQDMQDIEWQLKQVFSPELSHNAYWGIFNKEISNDARTLFDIHQHIRSTISWYRNPLGGWTVNYDKPFITDREQPQVKVSLLTTDPNYEIYLSFFQRLHHSINQMIYKMGWEDDQEKLDQWIQGCKDFALHEHNHITTTNTPLPEQEYLDFFNQYIDKEGYAKWKEIEQ